MGGQISTPQREVYYNVFGVFTIANVKLLKGELKKFLSRLFLHFPHTSPESITEVQFWDAVDDKFTQLAKSGDAKIAKSMFWPTQIKSTLLIINGAEKGKCLRELIDFPSSKSPIPSPRSLSPKAGILKGAAGEQKPLPTSPGSPRVLKPPRLNNLGRIARDSCGSLCQAAQDCSFPRSYPVNKPKVWFSLAGGEPLQNGASSHGSQNGGDLMARSSSLSSLTSLPAISPSPPCSQNPFRRSNNPFLSSAPPSSHNILSPQSPPLSHS